MKEYKICLAVDAHDYATIAAEVKEVAVAAHGIDFSDTVTTPDAEYVILYWDCINWDMPEVSALKERLSDMRHALITVDEEDNIVKDFKSWDDRGTDEEFDEILAVRSDILYWEFGKSDMTPLAKEAEFVTPIPRERLIQLLKDYMSWDIYGIGNGAVFYDNLIGIGFSHEEIKALGYGCVIPEDEEEAPLDVVSDIANRIRESNPEIIDDENRFPKKLVFNIGFINPHIENFQGDGIANDETQLDASSVFELALLYCEFCRENKFPCNTVNYVELAEPLEEDTGLRPGDRVRLIEMPNDPRPVPPMTEGTVKTIDDAGHIHVAWDNGQSLALIPGVDKFEIIDTPIPVSMPVKPCVVITHSFDSDTPVYEYDSEEEAVKALKRLYTDYYAEEVREGSALVDSECFCEDDYAKVTWADGCVTEFKLSYTSKEV